MSTLTDSRIDTGAVDRIRSDSAATTESVGSAFNRLGYLAGVPILSRAECARFLHLLRTQPAVAGADWDKGKHVTSRLFYEIATHARIVQHVSELLGENVMLWGTSLVVRKAGQVHAWHTDYETSNPHHRCVSVWLGLKHVSQKSSLALISRSHLLGVAVKDVQLELGKKHVSADELADWARAHDPRCELLQLPCTAGEAIFFDGRLWHGSDNGNLLRTRVALLLQFAAPSTPIRIPDFTGMPWPPRFHEHPLPASIMIKGDSSESVNRIVPPPAPLGGNGATQLRTLIRPINLPLELKSDTGWSFHEQFRGMTSNVSDMECHVSVLAPGKTPHPPHQHAEEEVLIVLNGEATLRVDESGTIQPKTAPAGSLIYYPCMHAHTITNLTSSPLTYLMFKWTADDAQTAKAPVPMTFFNGDTIRGSSTGEQSFKMKLLFEGPTTHLTKLHSHVSVLQPGGGYDAHVDAHDVAIVVLEGSIQTLGQTVQPHGVIYYAAGEAHGMRCVGDAPARYLVLEFHGRHASMKRVGHPISRAAYKWGGYTLHRAKRFIKKLIKRK